MPELPDVEVYRQYCQSTSLYQRIEDVEVFSERILEDLDGVDFRGSMMGSEFQGTERHGKYLFLNRSQKGWMSMHFGMTGRLKYYQGTKEPAYTQVLFIFNSGYNLALIMPRKLGAISLPDSVSGFIKKKGLGPDVFKDDFNKQVFLSLLAGSRAMIKSQLMNQQVMAGIGNVYSDEILFQAEIHPRTKIKHLSKQERVKVYRSLNQVLESAIQNQADPEQFPSTYLTPRREIDALCPRCGGEIKRVKVSGRSSYYCPSCQPQK